MRKHRLLEILVLAILVTFLFPRPAYAYIDPGTTGSIFPLLAPFIALFLGFFGFLIRPIRRFFRSIFAKLRADSQAESLETNEASGTSSLPDNNENWDDIDENDQS